ncbi:MAG: asparagine synthase (glutamine-hydrolyzing) [Niastella sp.]|nr:asparagine synthase (glutamine-hydrolyzing) [Niastella sp.]PZR09063.1 MAG: asparagine synthase (glutamine-hydrolyzing) [Flavobacterium psychrophilum]
MCGIAGIIAMNPALASVERIISMTDALAHRGPDGTAHWTSPGGDVILGHRRLSIIDLSPLGAQPMHYGDRYSIVYNGEIYNYREIKDTLEQQGYRFRSQSDTEVILAAYDAWGTDCLLQFDGMFAFAIWDEQKRQLFAARDRFGEKPFFYYVNREQFFFASEMKALWALGIGKEMNEQMLFNYLTLGYVQNPKDAGETFYKNIRKLPARHFLLYEARKEAMTLQSYWDIDLDNTVAIDDKAAAEQLRELLSLSVNRRLRSDVPVGTSLSGGLDSASVLACIHQAAERPASLQSFSAVFPGFVRDESAQIGLTANQFGVANHQVQPGVDHLLQDFERVCYHQEEPFQSASIAAQFGVFALAKEHGVTVLLDGQGADEILGGYSKYYPWYWRELYRQNKPLLRNELQQVAEAGHGNLWGWQHKLAARLPHFAETYLVRQRERQQRRHADLNSGFVDAYGISYYDMPHVPTLNGALYYNAFLNGLEELLRYADRNSMAHGREVRLPFLFHELVAFVFSLPAGYKIRDGYTKWVLRKSMEQALPPSIVWRKDKVGFEPPQQLWMQDKRLAGYIREAQSVLVKKGILKPGVLDKKIQPQETHAADNFDWRYLVAGTLLH